MHIYCNFECNTIIFFNKLALTLRIIVIAIINIIFNFVFTIIIIVVVIVIIKGGHDMTHQTKTCVGPRASTAHKCRAQFFLSPARAGARARAIPKKAINFFFYFKPTCLACFV